MAVELREHQAGRVLLVNLTGRLDKEDYERLVSEVEQRGKQHDEIRMMVEVHDFQGWDAGVSWEDVDADTQHFNDLKRLAVVGEKKWEEGLAKFSKPFTTAEVRFFEPAEAPHARVWIEGL